MLFITDKWHLISGILTYIGNVLIRGTTTGAAEKILEVQNSTPASALIVKGDKSVTCGGNVSVPTGDIAITGTTATVGETILAVSNVTPTTILAVKGNQTAALAGDLAITGTSAVVGETILEVKNSTPASILAVKGDKSATFTGNITASSGDVSITGTTATVGETILAVANVTPTTILAVKGDQTATLAGDLTITGTTATVGETILEVKNSTPASIIAVKGDKSITCGGNITASSGDVAITGTTATVGETILSVANVTPTTILAIKGDQTVTVAGDTTMTGTTSAYTKTVLDVKNSSTNIVLRCRADGKASVGRDLNGQYSETFVFQGIAAAFPITNQRHGFIAYNPGEGNVFFMGYNTSGWPYGPLWASTSTPCIAFPATEELRIGAAVSATTFLAITDDGFVGLGATPTYGLDGFPSAKFGDSSNYTLFNTDGGFTCVGNARRYEDLRVSLHTAKVAGVHDPQYTSYKKNVGGTSTGVYAWAFDKDTEEELTFEVQLPHAWVEGSTIYPHVHWVPKTTSDEDPANQKVCWGLEYTKAKPGDVYSTTTSITGYTHTPSGTLTADKHYITDIGAGISMTGDTISTVILCRIYRAAADETYDTYDDDAYGLSVDFHILVDTLGSVSQTGKTS